MMFGIKAGLENILKICAKSGDPQNKYPCIQVVGTNGKGSASFWLMRILEAHGLRVGLFTSPHLISLRERIRIGDTPIPETDVERLLRRVKDADSDEEITFFEALTAVAFLWFAEQKPDVVILEAGLGGRLDSTNIVPSQWAILTSVGFDHMEILGDTLEKILVEKLGVWKPEGTLFHNLQDPTLQGLAEHHGKRLHGNLVAVPRDTSLQLAHPGSVYQENASLSIACAKAYLGARFSQQTARQVLRQSVWVGRQQELRSSDGAVQWILDGAHNGHAANRLAETLSDHYPSQKFLLILAVLKTKHPAEIVAPLLPYLSEVILTRTLHPKMRDPSELANLFPGLPVRIFPDVTQALNAAAQSPGIRLCTGSLYFIGATIAHLRWQYESLAWFRQFTPDDNERK